MRDSWKSAITTILQLSAPPALIQWTPQSSATSWDTTPPVSGIELISHFPEIYYGYIALIVMDMTNDDDDQAKRDCALGFALIEWI